MNEYVPPVVTLSCLLQGILVEGVGAAPKLRRGKNLEQNGHSLHDVYCFRSNLRKNVQESKISLKLV